MTYIEHPSNNELKDIIQNYWTFEVLNNPSVTFPINHETLPESSVSLVFINQPYFNGLRVMGPHTLKYKQSLFPNSIFLGIKFQPWITIKSLTNKKTDIVNKTTDTTLFYPRTI